MIRTLHIVGRRLDRAGAETWLMHLLRSLPRDRFSFDFLVHSSEPGDFDEEARSLGAQIFVCPSSSRPLTYARQLGRVLREYGPYDIVHSHTQHFSGYALLLARIARVPVRVAHSHLDSTPAERGAGLIRKAYLDLAQRSIRKNATIGLATSGQAGDALFGRGWREDARFRTHYVGIDMTPFRRPHSRRALREELGLPLDALVIGHVGRFHLQKNHAYLVEIAAEIMQREAGARLVLVGEGPLRPQIEARVRELGIESRVLFTGLRGDVPQLLRAFDVFLLPSFNEGLPVVLMETQAAGLPAVISNIVAPDNDTVPALVSRCRLDQPPAEWATQVLEAARTRTETRANSLAIMEASPFNIEHGVQELLSLYEEAVTSAKSRGRGPLRGRLTR